MQRENPYNTLLLDGLKLAWSDLPVLGAVFMLVELQKVKYTYLL
jgi:hypothetical protein